jgi:hypothetical protein
MLGNIAPFDLTDMFFRWRRCIRETHNIPLVNLLSVLVGEAGELHQVVIARLSKCSRHMKTAKHIPLGHVL